GNTEYFISIQMFRPPLLLPDGTYQAVKQEFIKTYSSYKEMKNMYWTIMNKYGFHKRKNDKKRKV
ncbi:hypothetical protein U2060_15405, partial [Listeria monocytogenes]|uniref:hypothetical protein n=1 Tax=Listeria monocytogenes TaxID=1639 RepID=UPI002FDB9EA6